MTITGVQLLHIAPNIKFANVQVYTDLLNEYMPKYEINTKGRISCFLAQIAHESAEFNATKEFASGQEYEGRHDLGNVTPGDGVKFKGRGLIQCTGRGMYTSCSKALFNDPQKLLDHPELLEAPPAATESACWFWSVVKGLNQVADKPEIWKRVWDNRTFSKFEWITLRINGGQNGLAERQEFLRRAEEIL